MPPVNANLVRELAARRESPTLDFKRADYHWNDGGNRELAKDLMAIANSLGPAHAPGYILIGVEEVDPEKTGRVVGVDPNSHLNDADLHQKVLFLLNRTPNFSYTVVEVDGL